MSTEYHQNSTHDNGVPQLQRLAAESEALDSLQTLKEYVGTVKNLYHEAIRENEPADKILTLRNQLKSACDEFEDFWTRHLYPSGTPVQPSYIFERSLDEKRSVKPYIPPRRFFAHLETYIRTRQLVFDEVWEEQLDVLLTESQRAFLNKKKQECDNVYTYQDVRQWFIDRHALTEKHLIQWIKFYNFLVRARKKNKYHDEFYQQDRARRDMDEIPSEITMATLFIRGMNDHHRKRAIKLVGRHAVSRDLDCDDVTFLVGFANEQWDYFKDKQQAKVNVQPAPVDPPAPVNPHIRWD